MHLSCRYDAVSGSEHGTSGPLLLAWAYEARRLFRDKLASQQHVEKFDGILATVLRSDWGVDISALDKKYFVTYGDTSGVTVASPHGKTLGLISSKDYKEIIAKGAKVYSREVRDLKLHFFPEVLSSMALVERVLTAPGGNLLLAGRSGVGRRTALSVIAHMHRMQVISPKVSRNYSLKQLKIDLRSCVQAAGVEGEQVVLLLEDHQLLDPTFLESINSLLCSGEVPGLLTPEELDTLISPLKEQLETDEFDGTLGQYFIRRIMRNLHIVFILDSSNPNFRPQCEANPALYTKCQFIWLESWAPNTMARLPRMVIPEIEKERSKFHLIHNSVADSTPRQYLASLDVYNKVLDTKKRGIKKKQEHLIAGVSKLNEAKTLVDDLKAKAAVKSKVLAEKQKEADEALNEITARIGQASENKQEMEVLKGKLGEETVKLEQRKKAIDIELAEIQPLVDEAKAAVGNIKSEALSEIRSLRAPPDVIRDILEGVLQLMGIFDTSWVSMRSFLAKRGVKEEIISFDARKIAPEIRNSVEALLQKNKKSFDPKVAKRASVACAPLASWVRANVQFSIVLEKIGPLEGEQRGLMKKVQKSQMRVENLEKALDVVEQEVAEMRCRFDKRTTEASRLAIELDQATETITAAENLVGKLVGEHTRWTSQVEVLQSELEELPLLSQVAASFITYLGAYPEDVRAELVRKWSKEVGVSRFELNRFLSTESEQLQWKAEGLPSDALSVENALIILHGTRTPFLIDPSCRASSWLKENLKNQRLEVINANDNGFMTALELAVRFGKTLLIQEMDTIDPALFPLLRGDFISSGPRSVVQVGEKLMDYNEDFKLFLTTRNPKPDLPPSSVALLSIVNFSTTRAGLTGQLLAVTIQHEKPQLEERKSALLAKEESQKVELNKLEESLLEELANAQGSILENKSLIESLNQTKKNSVVIMEALTESQNLQTSLDEERNIYLKLAETGATLYFVIKSLSSVNCMYRFSLTSFLTVFKEALQAKTSSGDNDRIESLVATLKVLLYESICRSLFKADRLMFALHLVHGMHPEMFNESEWELLTGQIVTDTMLRRQESQQAMAEKYPSWISAELVPAVALLESATPALFREMHLEDENLWSNFGSAKECEKEIPRSVSSQVSEFQKLLIVQTLRPDRLISSMQLFAQRALGVRELSPPVVNLKRLYQEQTKCHEPILVLISPGSDVSQELQELAHQVVGPTNYVQVAMGQGQSQYALQQLRECAVKGMWLCLKNLHLVIAWAPVLEKEINALKPHQNFRLWLTAEPHLKFPLVLLESSLKVTYESPPGVKKNLLRTYEAWTPQFIEKGHQPVRSQALFALAWFHAIIQERRNFIPQGWTKFYEFSNADLRSGADIIDRLCTSTGSIQWDFIHGLFENAVFGGRVDNNYDLEVLRAYLHQYFDRDVLGGKGRKKLAGILELPLSVNHKDFVKAITALPETDTPAMFNLPQNVDRSQQRSVAKSVLSQLVLVSRPNLGDEQFDKARWTKDLSPFLHLWKRLNQGSELVKLSSDQIPNPGENDPPLLAFLLLERQVAIKLLQLVHSDLSRISKVIRGTLLLTTDVKDNATALLKHEVPGSWCRKWEGPAAPIHWLRSLVSKTLALGGWVERCQAGTLLTSPADLSELFNPAVFLNALRQESARRLNLPINSLEFVSHWGPSSGLSKAKCPVTIEGLTIEGALFDGHKLVECARDSPSNSPISNCSVAWVPAGQGGNKDNQLETPVYYNSLREQQVTSIRIPCPGSPALWKLKSVALILKNQ